MKTLSLAVACLCLLAGCTPLSAVTMAGSMVNKVMDSSTPESFISDTRPPINSRDVADANINLGIEYMRLGKYELALEKLHYARQVRPDYALVYDVLGLLYQRMNQHREAEQFFQHALKLDPENPSTLNNYGQFLCSQDREEDADRYFIKAAENPLYQTPEIPYTNIGTCAWRNQNPDKAVEYFGKALALNPYIPHALINSAEILHDRRDYAAARDYLDRYLNLAGQSPRSLWLGIRIEQALGDKNKVSSYALLLRNKYPESDEAKLLAESGIR